MSRYKSDPDIIEFEKPSACSNFLHYSWKTITCLFSHITLISMVVSYCVLGAFTFESLEVEHERKIKRGISKIRENTTLHLWNFTQEMNALEVSNFTARALIYLKDFESGLLKAMTKDGWDGVEDMDKVQWTSTGSLFYSIVVITTIGYGHIAPKTTWGKVVTIFYAILGIPLMLLCLSNIGDVMATSFRFLYWRVCCYVCTKKPKKLKRAKSYRGTVRSDGRFSRSRNTSFRRSVRTSGRSTDSGYALSDMGRSSHSDTELRYPDDIRDPHRGNSLPNRPNRYSEPSAPSRKMVPSQNQNHQRLNTTNQTGGSLDRRKFPSQRDVAIDLDPLLLENTSVLCNRYIVGKNDALANSIPGITLRANERPGTMYPNPDRRALSMPRTARYLEPPRYHGPSPESSDREDVESLRTRPKKARSPALGSSPKMMTPLGYGHRSKYLDDPESDDEHYDDFYESGKPRIKPVPIWLCVLLVISYILAGAYLFNIWEEWSYLDAAYFCFVTLTTIGFGDLVPAKNVNQDPYRATVSIALCSLYLLFGISLLAMSFNLVQEEVISNVKSVAKRLGIIKSDSEDESEDED